MKKIYIERLDSRSEIGSMIIDCDQASFKFNRADGYLFATKTVDAKSSEVVLIKVPNWAATDIEARRSIEFAIVKDFAMIYERFYQTKNGILFIHQTGPRKWDFAVANGAYAGKTEDVIQSIILEPLETIIKEENK